MRIAFSVQEAALSAGVGLTKLREEIRNGRLQAHRLGARVLISSDDLANWLAALPSHRRATPAEQPREMTG